MSLRAPISGLFVFILISSLSKRHFRTIWAYISSYLDLLEMAPIHFEDWRFDVSSFMILLGESEEANYRMMRRSFTECLTAAPVAGLQNYLRSNYSLYETMGPSYSNPVNSKTAPLRNMRTARTISHLKLLKSSGCTVYSIKERQDETTLAKIHWQFQIWNLFTWIALAGIFTLLSYVKSSTWIGISTCAIFSGWSIINRVLEYNYLENAQNKTSRPWEPDAVFFMGPRNSCLVLQGSRKDVCEWTGLGVRPIETRFATILRAISWTGSLFALLLTFIAIPNGSTSDQMAFIALNLLGQMNVKIGQRLNANRCLASLEKIADEPAATRTHVYGFLLRKFGDDDWVDNMNILPKSKIWAQWRKRVIADNTRDAKALYEECLQLGDSKLDDSKFDEKSGMASRTDRVLRTNTDDTLSSYLSGTTIMS